ncbi:MAG: YhcH/YjgK/YiaL family protein [Muribaculaceae bacterium]|nr:YhcH/YjgK/YiaL family protein [Muribaculaceae bacterium]
MILGDINNCHDISLLNTRISKALEWAKAHHNEIFPKGIIEIEEGVIKVNCEEVAMVPQQMLEAHRRYIDIHIPQSDEETIGWAPIHNLQNCITPYNDEKDIAFYGDAPQCLFPVRPGQFVIFFPEDAHAPNIGIGNHRKLCIKIAID